VTINFKPWWEVYWRWEKRGQKAVFPRRWEIMQHHTIFWNRKRAKRWAGTRVKGYRKREV